ncbi:sensor domain-containing diguanylate cyclase [Paracidobacterium acidisoli]|uniref:diguanylate cyclase n=1 Tax=Paracidobacterium acidisoli TaxID=2303751 RepID=A0A372IT99_9BACT|nr:diguanylate cyclase [Paracidobacterium acidisoli]MBT9330561.1 diguanylate cyclase [Paracidobacterium acidisoli]
MAPDHAGTLHTQITEKMQKPGFTRSEILQLLLLGVFYVAAVVEAMILGHSRANADVIWPANGILLGMMLRAPKRMWGLYLLEVSILNYLMDIFFHFPLAVDTGWVLGTIIEMTLAILFLQAHKSKNIDLMQVRNFLWFFIGAAVIAPISRPLVIGVVHLIFIHSLFSDTLIYMRDLYIGDVLGIAIMTPLVLLIEPAELKRFFVRRRWIESFALLGGFVALSLYIFMQNEAPITFLIFPVLLLMLFRLGTSVAAIAVVLLAIPAAYLTSYEHGPFSLFHSGHVVHGVLLLQLFLIVLVVTIYAVGATLREREKLQQFLQDSYREMEKLAETDFLSQLPNRRTVEGRLRQEWSIAFRQRDPLSLLMIDLDHFKSYNDEFGHPAGDALIALVAALLQQSLERPRDFAGRYGGEEFIVLLPYTPSQGAAHVGERIRAAVETLRLPETKRPVSVSIGAATAYPSIDGTIEELIQCADTMLYEAKTSGRNCVCIASDLSGQRNSFMETFNKTR